MIGRRERIVDDDGVVDVAPERRDDIETEGMPGDRLEVGDTTLIVEVAGAAD